MRQACVVLLGLIAFTAVPVQAQVNEFVLTQVRAEREPLINTLNDLVGIESGSRDYEGLQEISSLIAGRLMALGGEVDLLEPSNVYEMQDTPDRIGPTVVAKFRGRGTRRILLLAHMDTLYLKGMLVEQPFSLDGNYAY